MGTELEPAVHKFSENGCEKRFLFTTFVTIITWLSSPHLITAQLAWYITRISHFPRFCISPKHYFAFVWPWDRLHTIFTVYFSLFTAYISTHDFFSLKWSHFDPFWTIFFIRSTVNLEWFSGETVLEMLAWHCSTLREDINAITIMNNHLSWLEPSPQIPAPVFFKTKTPCWPVSWWHSQEVVQWFPASLELRQQWNHEKT